jgi:flagellar motor switch protein FliG
MQLPPHLQAQFDDMRMAEKIAIFLSQLDKDTVAKIFSRMEVDTITEISSYMINAEGIDKQVATAILEEFHAIMTSNQYIKVGGYEQARDILVKALGPEESQKVMSKILEKTRGRNFTYLDKIKPQQLADFIINEHPQTIAIILAHMDATQAADTLTLFHDDLRGEVAMRIANLGDISPSIIKRVSTVLEGKLEALTKYKVEVGGEKAVAEIINNMASKASNATMAYIKQVDEYLGSRIQENMFVYEDMLKLSDQDLKSLIHKLDKKTLNMSLKGADDVFKDRIFSVMTNNAATVMKEDIEALGKVPVKNVELARKEILNILQTECINGNISLEKEDMVD